jgi:hypothetical protein
MEVSGELHATAALISGRSSPVSIAQEVDCVPEPTWEDNKTNPVCLSVATYRTVWAVYVLMLLYERCPSEILC